MYESGKFVEINGKKYYQKPGVEGYAYTEVIACKLADILGIRCAKYENTINDGEVYYLSEYLGDNFSTLDKKVKVLNNNLYDIWDKLEKEYPKYCEKLMTDIVKIYLFDILFLNSDRNVSNIGIITEKGIPNIVMFDNELLFSSSICLSSKYDYKDKSKFNRKKYKDDYDEVFLHDMEELSYFLETSDKKYKDLFVEMVNKVSPEVVGSIVKDIDEDIYEEVMNMYNINYKLITDVINGRSR